MGRAEDFARRGAGLLVLARLSQGPATMTEFSRVSELSSDTARDLRDTLVELGLVRVEELPTRGSVNPVQIVLTPLGERVAVHASAIKRALDDADRAHDDVDANMRKFIAEDLEHAKKRKG